MLSESLGTKRGTRERGKKEKAVEIWEPNPVFFGGGKMDWLWWCLNEFVHVLKFIDLYTKRKKSILLCYNLKNRLLTRRKI